MNPIKKDSMDFVVLKKQNIDIDKKNIEGKTYIGGNANVAIDPLTKQIVSICLTGGL